MPVVDRVIAGGRPGWPPRRLSREMAGRPLPVIYVLDTERWLPSRYARCVRKQVAHLDVLFAVVGEFGPVLRHRRVCIDQTPVDGDQRGEGGECLGAGEEVDDRVLPPRDSPRAVGVTCPRCRRRARRRHQGRSRRRVLHLWRLRRPARRRPSRSGCRNVPVRLCPPRHHAPRRVVFGPLRVDWVSAGAAVWPLGPRNRLGARQV